MLTKFRGMKAIYAHGHNGSLYRAERGVNLLREATINAIADPIREALQGLVNRGTLTPLEAGLMYNHMIWVRLGELGQIEYRFELQGQSKDIWEKNRDLLESILEKVR